MLRSSLCVLLCSPTATGTAVQLGARTPPTAPRPTWASAVLPTPPRGHTDRDGCSLGTGGDGNHPREKKREQCPFADDTEWKNLAWGCCWGKRNQHNSAALGEALCSWATWPGFKFWVVWIQMEQNWVETCQSCFQRLLNLRITQAGKDVQNYWVWPFTDHPLVNYNSSSLDKIFVK